MDNSTTIDLIRHGEPKGGTLFRGWQDDPLSDTGWSQMRSAVENRPTWDRIITSPLLRCSEFASELEQQSGKPCMVDPRLKELGFGDWEGADPAAVYEQMPEALGNFWKDPCAYPPPGGESMVLFQSRVEAAWQDLQILYPGEHLLVVAHGGVNRMIIGKVLGMPVANIFRMEIPYAGISRIKVDEGIPRLVFHCGQL